MPGFTTDDSQAMLLDFLTGRAVAFTAVRNTYLGLAITVPDPADGPITLTSIGEVVTAGYARVLAPWAAPSGSPIFTASSANIQFGPVTVDMTDAANYAFLTQASTGTVGTVLYVWSLVEPVLAKASKPIFVASGALTIQ